MRTTIGIATFCIVGAGAVGVSALSLKGSDTLKDLTVTLLTTATLNGNPLNCGGLGNNPVGTLSYEGTGSGNGQAAMLGGAQDVAPMSSRLSSAVCAAFPGKAEGIVFALDGVSIVASSTTVAACNGTTQLTAASCGADAPAKGLAANGNLGCHGGYALTDWRDVLRLIYFGFEHTSTTSKTDQNCGTGTGAVGTADCRTELVNNYAKIFQGSCTPGNSCTQLRHAFRRNDESGTTDVFIKSIAGFPGIDQAGSYTPFCNAATTGPTYNDPGVTCTAAAAADDNICSKDTTTHTLGTCNTTTSKCTVISCDADSDCGSGLPAGVCASSKCTLVNELTAQSTLPGRSTVTINGLGPVTVSATSYFGVHYSTNAGAAGIWVDMQDGDTIRRSCPFQGGTTGVGGLEQVCGADGKLGVVLPIYDATSVSNNVQTADAFPDATCDQGQFTCTSANRISRVGTTNVYSLCPDGTDPNTAADTGCTAGQCQVPFTGASNFQCNDARGNLPPGSPAADGRVYNQTVWVSSGGGAFTVGKYARSTGQAGNTFFGTSANMPMYLGAFFRLHQNFTLAGSATGRCRASSATDQISCLVQASPCSIGYAGNSAVTGNTVAINVNNVAPSNACIQNLLILGASNAATYPLSRNLYLNTVKGFGSIAGDQLKLAECFSNPAVAEQVAVNSFGFIPLPSNTIPFCDDVAASTICNQASACANNPSGIPTAGFPNASPGNSQTQGNP